MKKIVLALALVAVTPAVLVAQENGNAYNKSTNEVIASNTKTQQLASSAYFGPGSKILYVSDNALERIRQQYKTKKQNKPQKTQKTVQQTKTIDTTPAYYVYAGREGHMMALENLGKSNKNKAKKDTVPTYIKDAETISRNDSVNLGNNNKDLIKSEKKRNSTFRYYVKLVTESITQNALQEK